jgi:enamine deaminase RidA (YjgF/YER057c/UK114 family)
MSESSIQRLHAGPRMSQAVVHGGTVYLAGQVADKAKGGSVTEQTKEILATIERLLTEAGSDKTRILSATIYLPDIATFAEMNAVWEAWVAPGHTPARATVEAKLAAPAYTVEIACIAAGRA